MVGQSHQPIEVWPQVLLLLLPEHGRALHGVLQLLEVEALLLLLQLQVALLLLLLRVQR